jgi:hypothetical protein
MTSGGVVVLAARGGEKSPVTVYRARATIFFATPDSGTFTNRVASGEYTSVRTFESG